MKCKEGKPLLPRKEVPCRATTSQFEKTTPGKIPRYYDAFPRDCKFAYMTPGFYAVGFRILDVYKTEVDFSEMRSLGFLEEPDQANKWGHLKTRIPFPEGRITDLPGSRKVQYHNYCLRSLTPESAMSWRNSITRIQDQESDLYVDEKEPLPECLPLCPPD